MVFTNSNPSYSSEKPQEELLSLPRKKEKKKKKISVENFCESQETPFSSKHGKENAISDFPLVIRFAKVDLQGIKTWKHLKYQ